MRRKHTCLCISIGKKLQIGRHPLANSHIGALDPIKLLSQFRSEFGRIPLLIIKRQIPMYVKTGLEANLGMTAS